MSYPVEDRVEVLAAHLNAHVERLCAQFVARRTVLELVMLGLITREHVLLIGPPGTGKSAVVHAIAASLDLRAFDYLIGRFTEPSELFGALDLNALKDGLVRPVTAGMLPEAQIAFLDEIFLGSTAILNSLLKLLNERTYRRGQFSMDSPLLTCVAASNALPDDPALAAFADRFLLTAFVDPVSEEMLPDLLRAGWRADGLGETPIQLNAQLFEYLHLATRSVDLDPIHESLAHLARKIRLAGAALSDRKLVKAQKLIAAACVLRGRLTAGPEDLWPVTFLVQSKPQQGEVRELLQVELKHSMNPVLSSSVAAATLGATAHATRLVEQATALLEASPAHEIDEAHEIWLVRIETLMVRIDAAFGAGDMPKALRAVRDSLATRLEAAEQAASAAAPAEPSPTEVG